MQSLNEVSEGERPFKGIEYLLLSKTENTRSGLTRFLGGYI